MKTVLFLQSEEPNPFELYKRQLVDNPVYRDESMNITAVYNYADCLTILNSTVAFVPPQNNAGLNEHALLIAGNLARFRSIPQHGIAKKAARELYRQIKPAPIRLLLTHLLNERPAQEQVDWVEQVSRRLPALTILNGFRFNEEDCRILTDAIGTLVKIMQAVKTSGMIEQINSVSQSCYKVIENQILRTMPLNTVVNDLCAEFSCSKEDALAICVANLAGLIMQSYDACSGLLSHTLFYALTGGRTGDLLDINDLGRIRKFVTEVLRYDPPVHNTRRIATGNTRLDGIEISRGENLLVVLAAANRDEKQFRHANTFDIDRINNESQLTFGVGMHACVASQFAIGMATETLYHFFALFPNAQLLSDCVEYEPIINARLPVSVLISLS